MTLPKALMATGAFLVFFGLIIGNETHTWVNMGSMAGGMSLPFDGGRQVNWLQTTLGSLLLIVGTVLHSKN